MSNDNNSPSPETVLQDLFPGKVDEAIDGQQLLERIIQLLDTDAEMSQVAACIDRLRVGGNRELCSCLDQFLLTRIFSFNRSKAKLEAVHSKLKEELEQLLRPPYFPARYLGPVSMHNNNYATVAHDGTQRVVALGENLSSGDLRAGDEVYLCHQRNSVIAKAPKPTLETGETATFARMTEEGCLVLNDHDTEVIVRVRDDLATDQFRPGDLLLWDRSARIVLRRIEQSGPLGHEDIADTSPRQLGGLDQKRDGILDRFIFSILQPELAREYHILDGGCRRLLLQGPPGTGKTTLMRIIASRLAHETNRHCRVVTISGAELYSSYVGETERNIRRCFTTLKDYDGPGIVFFDEIDAIGRTRGNVSGFHDDRFLGTLLAELEGMHRCDVAVIAATNRPDMLDPALRSRFSWEIEMPRPNMKAARQIFSIHLPEKLPYRSNGSAMPGMRQALIEAGVSRLYDPNTDNAIVSLQFRDGTRRTVPARELVSGRLIEQICAAVRAAAFERQCRGGEPGVAIEDMTTASADAIERLRKTLSRHNIRNYLADIPQDLDVVSVEPIRARIETAAYVC